MIFSLLSESFENEDIFLGTKNLFCSLACFSAMVMGWEKPFLPEDDLDQDDYVGFFTATEVQNYRPTSVLCKLLSKFHLD